MGRSIVHASRIVPIAKAEGSTAEGVHRLEDIEVQEVSLVDRPANKRPFIIVKRNSAMPTEVRDDGKGGMTTKAGPPPMAAAAGGAAPGGDPPAPPGKKKPKAVGKLDVPPGFKEMMGPMLSKASEKLQELADSVSSSTPGEVGDDGEMPPVPGEFSDALQGIMGTLDKLSSMWPSSPSGSATGADGADQDPSEEPPMPSEMQMRAAVDNVSKVFGHPKVVAAASTGSAVSVVAKIGAKMSKDRLSVLQQAHQALGSLLSQVAPPPPAAAAAGALGKSEDLLKSIDAMLAPVISGLAKVAGVVQGQSGDISQLKKSRGAPNAATNIEGTAPVKNGGAFNWPLDLNRPLTKDTVSKTESFFGDE